MFNANRLQKTACAVAFSVGLSGVPNIANAQWFEDHADNYTWTYESYYEQEDYVGQEVAHAIGNAADMVNSQDDNPNPEDPSGSSEPSVDAIKDLAKEGGVGEMPVDFWKTQFGKDLIKKGKGSPINPVHNPGTDDTGGGLSVDVTKEGNTDIGEDLDAFVEELMDVIDQATKTDVEGREDVDRKLSEIMAAANTHNALLDQIMPVSDQEEEESDRHEAIDLLMEAVEDEETLTGPPERVNPDPTTRNAKIDHAAHLRTANASVAALAVQTANRNHASVLRSRGDRLETARVEETAARDHEASHDRRTAKLDIVQSLPKRAIVTTAPTSWSSAVTRAAKPGVAKLDSKHIAIAWTR